MLRFSVFSLLIVLPLSLLALENKFEYITAENGLSQGNIECIFQDSRGYMWFGTYNGLNRYDGYTIKIFNHDIDNPNSLAHEHVTQIAEDSDGKLWIGTRGGGISVFDPNTWTFHTIFQEIIDGDTIEFSRIGSIIRGDNDLIWFSDEQTGVFAYNKQLELVKHFMPDAELSNGLPSSRYYGMQMDDLGTLWLAIGAGSLGKIAPRSDKVEVFVFDNRSSESGEEIRALFIDSKQNIWLGTTSEGAFMYNRNTNSFTRYYKDSPASPISSNTVMAFAEDGDDIYMGMDGGGINILNRLNGSIEVVQYELGNTQSLNTNAVYELYFDRSGNLWVGTYSGGVNFHSRYKSKFKNYTSDPLDPSSLSYKNVTAIMQDRDGEMWIGTDGGGLNKFDLATDSFTHYRADPTNPEWLQTDVIIHLMQDDEGDIYIGSYNHGLTILDKNNMTWKQYLPEEENPNSASGIHPWYSFQDSYGTIWIGYLSIGLDRFDKETETFTNYPSDINDPTKLRNPNIKIIYEDMNLDLWLGTEGGGLHKYNRDQDNFTQYYYNPDAENTLSNNDVREIYEDLNGRFWVGTSYGLNIMNRDSGTFNVLTTEDGLAGNVIDGILEDELGYLWISSDGGLTKFHPDSMTFKNYDKTDGLQGNEFNYTAETVSNNGYFFFGGKSGFNMFFPRDIVDNPYPPPVVITEIQVMNKSYSAWPVKVKGKTVMKSVSNIKKLKFSHKQNILSFEFAALDYGNSVKNKYQYILEGFDKEWNTTTSSKRYATYTNLPGGDYIFRVKAANGDGVWNDEGVSLEITITPPFWKRTWFILLVLLIIVWLVVRYIRNREKSLQQDKELLERKIQEGFEEVNKQKAEMQRKDLELQKKIEDEREQNWLNVGMGRISEVMSKNKDNLHTLAQSIISEMVQYVEVSQGAIYLLNDDDENSNYLELMAAYAPDDERLIGKRIEIGEGQIGTCYKDGTIITVDNLPADYAKFASGLGEESLTNLVVIPLRLNEIAIGVVELLSFKTIPEYRINYIEKSGETLTSILTALKANDKTTKLFERQKMQAEELAAQEEELRQNLEEMQATQEELARMKESERVAEEERRAAEQEYLEQVRKQNEELEKRQEALKKEEYLFNALLENAKEYIYFKDKESKFLRLSNSMLPLFKLKSYHDVLGKTDFDLFGTEHAKAAFNDEQKIIKTGEAIIDQIEKETHKDGSITWVSTTKMPLKDQEGNIVGTWGISKDITRTKNLEDRVEQQKEKTVVFENVFQQTLNSLSGKAAIFNDKGIVFSVNEAFVKASKHKEEDILNEVIFDFMPDEEQKSLKVYLKTAKKEGKASWLIEEKNQIRKVKLIAVPIPDLDSTYYMYLEEINDL